MRHITVKISVQKARELFRETQDRTLKILFTPANTRARKLRVAAWAEDKRRRDPTYKAEADAALLSIGNAAVRAARKS